MFWDDGSHAKVKKVQLTFDEVIYSIQVTYEGSLQSQRRGSLGPKSDEFTLDADEYITSLTSVDDTLRTEEHLITALTFTTNKGRTHGPYGKPRSFGISVFKAPTGKQISGFHGISDTVSYNVVTECVLNAIDVHYAPVPTSNSIGPGTQKLDAQGGKGGTAWDDGSDHDGVTKIYVRSGGEGIQFVKFDYVKGGKTLQGAQHGGHSTRGATKEILIKHSDEYIISVEGWYDSSNVILGILFKTNRQTFDIIGYEFDSSCTKFTLQVKDKKIMGFHGFANTSLNSIGAYFFPCKTSTTTPPTTAVTKLKAEGGTGGTAWDDGSDHEGLTKIYVRFGGVGIHFVKFDYVKGGQSLQGAIHGESNEVATKVISINHPDEYIISVEGWYDCGNVILGIQFKTNQKTCDHIGYAFYNSDGATRFTLQVQDKKIIGFHGSANTFLKSIGAYFVPSSTYITTPPTSAVKKLKAEGGEKGTAWDDGHHGDVTKVYVGQNKDCIGAVKFEYKNGSQIVFGVEHGKSTKLGFDEFKLESEEYITSVEGTYDRVFGADDTIVTMLKFKTSKNRTSDHFGIEGSTRFILKETSYKITGFHGRAGEAINAIGAHVVPISN